MSQHPQTLGIIWITLFASPWGIHLCFFSLLLFFQDSQAVMLFGSLSHWLVWIWYLQLSISEHAVLLNLESLNRMARYCFEVLFSLFIFVFIPNDILNWLLVYFFLDILVSKSGLLK